MLEVQQIELNDGRSFKNQAKYGMLEVLKLNSMDTISFNDQAKYDMLEEVVIISAIMNLF